MARFLFLDDDLDRHRAFIARSQPHEVLMCQSPGAAIKHMKRRAFDVVFLDRDLGQLANGSYVAAAMARLPAAKRPKKVVVHSQNPLAALDMVRPLRRAGFHVVHAPWKF